MLFLYQELLQHGFLPIQTKKGWLHVCVMIFSKILTGGKRRGLKRRKSNRILQLFPLYEFLTCIYVTVYIMWFYCLKVLPRYLSIGSKHWNLTNKNFTLCCSFSQTTERLFLLDSKDLNIFLIEWSKWMQCWCEGKWCASAMWLKSALLAFQLNTISVAVTTWTAFPRWQEAMAVTSTVCLRDPICLSCSANLVWANTQTCSNSKRLVFLWKTLLCL